MTTLNEALTRVEENARAAALRRKLALRHDSRSARGLRSTFLHDIHREKADPFDRRTRSFTYVAVPDVSQQTPQTVEMVDTVVSPQAAAHRETVQFSAIEELEEHFRTIRIEGPETYSEQIDAITVAEIVRENPKTASAVPIEYHATVNGMLDRMPADAPRAVMAAAVDEAIDWSLVTHHLAIAMAERLNDPVLAIDATTDARLTRQFGVEPNRALNAALTNTLRWNEHIVQTRIPGLSLMATHGRGLKIDRGAFRRLVGEVTRHFGMVLVDVGTFLQPAARMVTSSCGGSFLLARLEETRKARAELAEQSISTWKGRLLGAIVTKGTGSGA